MTLTFPQLTPAVIGVLAATVLIALGIVYRKKATNILECYRRESSDTVKNRQLLFVRDTLCFMVDSQAEETLESMLKTPDPGNLTPNQMDALEQSLIQRCVRIKEEVTNLADRAKKINEPLVLFDRTEKTTRNTSRCFLGSGFVAGPLLGAFPYLLEAAMPWYYITLLGLMLMLIYSYRNSALAVEKFRRKLDLWKEEPLQSLGLEEEEIPTIIVGAPPAYYV